MRDNLFARQIWLGSSVMLLLLLMVTPSNAQQEVMTIIINSTESIDAVGNAQAHASVTFDPPQGYDLVRRLYLNLYVLFRDVRRVAAMKSREVV